MTLEELIVYTKIAGQYIPDLLLSDDSVKTAWIDCGGTHEVQIDYITYDDVHEFETAKLYRKPIGRRGSMAYPVRKLTLDELCEWVEK